MVMTASSSGRSGGGVEDGVRNHRSEKVSEIVAREIVQDIVARDLGPGTMLPPETEMLAAYGVGRASLREALRILEVHGLITLKPGRGGGPIVTGVSPQAFARTSLYYFRAARATFADLIEARLALEPMMAGLAAKRRDPDAIAALRASVSDTQNALTRDSSEDYIRGTTDFHEVVGGVSGNRILDLMGSSLKHIYAERVVRFVFPPDHREAVAKKHADIAEAIIKGRARAAENLMRDHMIEYAEHLQRRFPEYLEEIVNWS